MFWLKQLEKSHQNLFVEVCLVLFKTYISNFLKESLLSRKFRCYLTLLSNLAFSGRTPLFIDNLIFFNEILLNVLILRMHYWSRLYCWLYVLFTVTFFEFVYKSNVEILLFLLFYFSHLLLFHSFNNLKFLFLFYSFLIFVTLFHKFLHVVIDVFIHNLHLIQMCLESGFLFSLQTSN